MKVQFNGPEAEATVFGVTFPAGESVDVSELAPEFQAKLKHNQTFTVEGVEPDDVDVESLRAELTERGIHFHHKAGVAKLQALLSEANG